MAKSPPTRRIPPTRKSGAGKSSRPKSSLPATPAASPNKLDRIAAALRAPKGATLADLMKLTGWQRHSVRGALAGALKKRGHAVTSSKTGDERVYRIGGGA